VSELVRFDPRSLDRPLQVWNSVEQDLVERQLSAPVAASRVLHGFWLVVEDPARGPSLRLSHDERGERLYPSPEDRIRELEAALRNATATSP
jgi:hypothetical protein